MQRDGGAKGQRAVPFRHPTDVPYQRDFKGTNLRSKRTGRVPTSHKIVGQFCQLAALLGEEAKRAEVSLREARYAEMVGDYPSALAVLRDAVSAARLAQDVPQEGRALRAMGYVLWRKGDFMESLIQSEQALNLARSNALQDVEASTLRNLAVVHWRLGEPGKARSYANQCLELSRTIGDRINEFRARLVPSRSGMEHPR